MDNGLSLTTWFLLNVLLPLIPVAVVRMIYWVKGVAKNFLYILGDGQICFVCTSMVATTLNDVIGHQSIHAVSLLVLALIIATLLVALLFSTAAFVVAANESDVDDLAIRKRVSYISLIVTSVVVVLVLGIRGVLGL